MNYRNIFKTALSALILFTGARASYAQEEIPLNPEITTGELENGMKFFVMHNEQPKGKVEMRLVVNAGSILEEDHQQGLAHFTEHMAFNGTRNFQKNELVDYLQSVGVKFGAHLNAYTSFDETVYMLSLPTDNEDVMLKGYQVLQDWAEGLLFDQEEIDKERGVVLEEYRMRLGAQQRMMNKYLPVLLKDSRYATRLPIGKKEILEKFEREAITSFYKKWYRPDLMAVVVVGDVDAERATALIRSHFGSIQKPAEELSRQEFEVPANQDPLVSVATDKEAVYGMLSYYIKDESPEQLNEMRKYRNAVSNQLIFAMINERLAEISKKPDVPFMQAWMNYGQMWVRNQKAFQASCMVKDNRYEEAFTILQTEIERVRMFGFIESEFERAKQKRINALEKAANEASKTASRRHASRLVDHFLEGSNVPAPEWRLDFDRTIMDELNVQALTDQFKRLLSKENNLLMITGPENDETSGLNEHQFIDMILNPKLGQLEPYTEDEIASDLMTKAPKAGTIKDKKTIGRHTELTLSNGVKVVYMPTDYKNDQILFGANSDGGTSLLSDKEYERVRFGMGVIAQTGISKFSRNDLSKMTAGRTVSLRPYVGSTSEGLSGSCSPNDIDWLMKWIHLSFTDQRFDPEAFETYKNNQISFNKNLGTDPGFNFSIKWSEFLYGGHARSYRVPTAEDWAATDYEKIHQVYKDRFLDGSDFTFYFVGSINPESFEEYCKKYLANLPTIPEKEKYKDLGMRPKNLGEKLVVQKGSEPQSTVRLYWQKETDYKHDENLHLAMLGEVLSIKLTEVLREEHSGVYGSSARGSMTMHPYGSASFSISFPCGPENVDKLIELSVAELQKLIDEGPSKKDLDKVKQARIKQRVTDEQSNRFWLRSLQNSAKYGMSVEDYNRSESNINEVSIEDLQAIAKKFLSSKPTIGVLNPED